ncbi:GAF and ANTAR domain-containing protein [Arthrobacter sp. TMS1-12-1]
MATPPSSSDPSPIFGHIRGRLLTEQTAHDAVDGLAEAAVGIIRSAEGAGVSLIDTAGRRVSVGATSNAVLDADALQYEFGEGPCLSAWATGAPIYVADTRADDRWARWMTAAARNGIRSCLSVPLVKQEAALGAMKVYSASPDAFSDVDRRLLLNLARSAAALLGHIQTDDLPQRAGNELKAALASRDTIGITCGILMERHGIDRETAMAELIDLATSTGTSVWHQAMGISGEGTSGPDPLGPAESE